MDWTSIGEFLGTE